MKFVCLLCNNEFDDVDKVVHHLQEFHRVNNELLEGYLKWRYIYVKNLDKEVESFLNGYDMEVLDVEQNNGDVEVRVFFDFYDWEIVDIGRMIKKMEERGFEFQSISTDWVTIRYNDFKGYIVRLTIGIDRILNILGDWDGV